jgi:hypothetical protein
MNLFYLSPFLGKGFKSFEKMTMGQTTAGTVSFALAELLRVGGAIE